MIEKTIETEQVTGHLERVRDAVGRTLGTAGQFLSDRVLSPIQTGASRLAPVAEKVRTCATQTARGGADAAIKAGATVKGLVVQAGSAATDAIGDGLTAGHRVVRKVPGVARAEDRVSATVKGLPDRLDLVRADDIANLKRSIDSLNRQIDRLIEKATV